MSLAEQHIHRVKQPMEWGEHSADPTQTVNDENTPQRQEFVGTSDVTGKTDDGAEPPAASSGDLETPQAGMEAQNAPKEETELTGTVLAVQANYYRVQLDEISYSNVLSRLAQQPAEEVEDDVAIYVPQSPSLPTRELLCTRRSRLKKIGQQVMVGDRVVVEEPDWEGGRGAIAEVFPRQTELDRPPVANANQLLLVFAIEEPSLDPHQVTRFLVKAESTRLGVCLGLNKIDLVSPQELEHWKERLKSWGYEPLFISVENEMNLSAVLEQLQGKITIISGPSGVGKSSLINQFIPSAELRVADVSGKLGRGRHTTRHVELFELPNGGLLADTPGFNQPTIECEPKQLADYFPEARQRLEEGSCQFSNCLHRDEPNCVVRGDWERYEYYLEFLEEAIAYQEAQQQQSDPESNIKVKTKRKGTQQYEPKLESKKYRRISRRVQHQNLDELYQDLEEEEGLQL